MAAIEFGVVPREGHKTGRRWRWPRCLLLVLLLSEPCFAAAASWEYSPYNIRVWLAVAPRAELTSQVRQEIVETIRRRAEIEFTSTWNLNPAQPPAALAAELALGLERIGTARFLAVEPKVLTDDKLICVRVDSDVRGYLIQVRELDGHTGRIGPLVERQVQNPHVLGASVYSAIVATFAPITRIESGETQTAVVRLRAGWLGGGRRFPGTRGARSGACPHHPQQRPLRKPDSGTDDGNTLDVTAGDGV